MLSTISGNKVDLKDIYKNCSAFLILNGPSFSQIIESKEKVNIGGVNLLYKEALSFPGILTMGINNGVKSFRPKMWTCVDEPDRFIQSIWLDPTIQKFVPCSYINNSIFNNSTRKKSNVTVKNCPNIFTYHKNEKFDHKTFLTESTFNWGDHKNYGGGRSVMLVAIRLLYYMGIKRIFLLGCDFNMDESNKYHFDQDRTRNAIKNNNNTYDIMIKRFELLKPIFEKNELFIYNCNKDSRLKTFEFMDIKEALLKAYEPMPHDLVTEETRGMYEKDIKIDKKQSGELEVIRVSPSKTIIRKKKNKV